MISSISGYLKTRWQKDRLCLFLTEAGLMPESGVLPLPPPFLFGFMTDGLVGAKRAVFLYIGLLKGEGGVVNR